MKKLLLEYEFEYVQNLEPVLDRNGNIKEFSPQDSYVNKDNMALNKYGDGTFCRFSIHPKWSGVSGVYAFFIDDTLVYVGQALDFLKRFNAGYGNISARCCFMGGQSTNCKINKVVKTAANNGQQVTVYFHVTNNYHKVEKEIIQHYNPKYNTASRSDEYQKKNTIQYQKSKQSNPISNMVKNVSIDDVRKYIKNTLAEAKESGIKEVILQSGKIHNELNMKNAMPTVCNAMRSVDLDCKYDIIEQPPKGNGSRLILKYKL